MKLINIGFGNLVSAGRVVAVVSPDSAPVKRLVKEARERGMLIDASYGRSTRAVLIMDSDHVVLSALQPETVASRAAGQPEGKVIEEEQENEKYLFVVSGAAGTGKDSVVKALREAHPEIEKTVSATTRSPRPGEQEGVDYYYRTREQFQKLIEDDEVVEHNFYNGNYYGTLKEEVNKRLNAGKLVVLVIDVHGAANIRRMYPGATTVFLLPPSEEELERRLRGRGTETEESIRERLATAKQELAQQDHFAVKLVNNEIGPCAEALYQVICQRAGLNA